MFLIIRRTLCARDKEEIQHVNPTIFRPSGGTVSKTDMEITAQAQEQFVWVPP